jgi:hypothetical protein
VDVADCAAYPGVGTDVRGYPRLIEAVGRCPPEDVGEPWGYREFLTPGTNPRHEEHVEWRGCNASAASSI